jgi:hypothetical protein
MEIRGQSIEYISCKRKKSNKREIVIKEQIENLENSFIHSVHLFIHSVEQLSDLKE